MKWRFFTLILFVIYISSSEAKPRTNREMAAIASAKLSQVGMQSGKRSQTTTLKELKSTDYYAIYGNTLGFVIVTKDDRFQPIIGYSNSVFNERMIPSNFKWWLDAVNAYMSENPIILSKSITAANSVSPLMKTKWDQFEPYNNLTPTYTEKGETFHYPTGCLATAMAQIMYYYKHPKKGAGESAYYVNGKTIPIIIDFSQTEYDWDNILESYSSTYTEAQAEAVATLMYHCGTSVKMTYDKSGSGALMSNGCKAMRTNFSYPYSVIYFRNYCTGEEWLNMVYDELNAKRPIIYAGDDGKQTGHAFVLHGYDNDGLVYVNWGWSGYYDGYFDITLLNPGKDTYAYGQQMLIVNPEKDATQLHSSWALGEHLILSKLSDDKLSLSCDGFYNMDLSFKGTICLIAENESDIYELIGMDVTDNKGIGEGFSLKDQEVDIKELSIGTYRLYLASKSENESSWQSFRAHETINRTYILEKTASGIFLTEGEVPTSIGKFTKSELSTPRYFDLQGREVNGSTKGLIIRRQGDEVKKVIVR